MNRIRYTLASITVLCAALCLAPRPVAGQDGPRVVDRRGQAVVVGWGEGSTIGLWTRVGDRMDVGLEGFFSVIDEDMDADDESTRIVGVRPALKGYLGDTDASVGAYWIAGLFFEHAKFELGSLGGRTTRSIGGLVGVGLDWFPAERVSVGAHVGLEGAATRSTQPVAFPPGAADEELSGYQLRTLSSGIRLQLWF